MVQNNPISERLKKRRQLLMVLPLLIVPFVTLAFWAMGGGKRAGESAKSQHTAAGINSEVPKANVSFQAEDKLSLYQDADRKAEARKQALGQFSYPVTEDSVSGDIQLLAGGNEDPNSLKVEQKLADLQKILDGSSGLEKRGIASSLSVNPAIYGLQPGEQLGTESEEQLNRLDSLNEWIARKAESGGGSVYGEEEGQDGDMQQINTMLDKILAIQHPEKDEVGERLKQESRINKGRVYSMQLAPQNLKVPVLRPVLNTEIGSRLLKAPVIADTVTHLTGSVHELDSGALYRDPPQPIVGAFYEIDMDLDPNDAENDAAHYTVQAVIAASQTLVSGAAVKMRLTADVFIGGTLIPKGNFVYGISTVNGERLKITVSHIRFHNQIFPVHLKVYDLDGMEGIRIPGAIGRDASKEGADRGLQSVQMMSLDPSITAQAASAGIEATKGLLSKKVKLVRVTVKAGYPVLLLDEAGEDKKAK